MKKNHFSLFLIFFFILISCEQNPCDSGYSYIENSDGSSYCLKDFEYGIENYINEYGNTFYHDKLGVIIFENGKWINEMNENISFNLD